MKRYQVLTDGHFGGGIDEKMEYSRITDAIKAAKEYLRDGYEGAAVYDLKLRCLSRVFGDFRDWILQ